MRRTKHLFRERVQKGFPDEPLLVASQTRGVVSKTDYGQRTVEALKDLHLLKLVESGDYVISLRSFEGGIEYAHQRGIISPAYTVLIPSPDARRDYFQYFFKSAPFVNALTLFVTGIREGQNIDYERLSRSPLPLPPPEEQTLIGRFLNNLTLHAERLIRAKRRMIDLLNEQKQAIIQRAVTRGLNPNAPLTPSRIPWLGDIPRRWGLIPLKSVSAIQSGITLGKRYPNLDLKEYAYLRVANVQAGHLNLTTVKTLGLPAEEACRSLLQVGDVLMTEGGDPDKLGRGCVWKGEVAPCLHQNHIFAVRTDQNKLRSHFLAALLTSHYAKNYFLLTAKQTTNLASTNKSTIGRLRVLLPDTAEQDEILNYLGAETAPVNRAIARAQREIELIREYRTRLVADVVTGQLDVRAAAANLPTNIQQPGPEAEAGPDAEDEPEETTITQTT